MKHRKSILAVLVCMALLLAGCGAGPAAGQQPGGWDGNVKYDLTKADETTEFEELTPLDYPQNGDPYTISEAGAYRMSGRYEGELRINVDEDELVYLVLDNAAIYSTTGPAINVQSADKLVLVLAPGSENTVRDSGYHYYEDTGGCVYASCDITINGGGKLSVYGYYKDGIRTKDYLRALGSDLQIKAVGDGLRANDGLWLDDSAVSIECEGNGIYTENSKGKKGHLYLTGGRLNVIAGEYGVSLAGDFYHSGETGIYGVMGDEKLGGAAYSLEEGAAE